MSKSSYYALFPHDPDEEQYNELIRSPGVRLDYAIDDGPEPIADALARRKKLAKADKIPGGLAQGKKPSDFPKKKLDAGITVEMEHTTSRAIAQEIAMDHLVEDIDYYQKLKKIEKALPKKQVKRPGSRGGKYHYGKHGDIHYGSVAGGSPPAFVFAAKFKSALRRLAFEKQKPIVVTVGDQRADITAEVTSEVRSQISRYRVAANVKASALTGKVHVTWADIDVTIRPTSTGQITLEGVASEGLSKKLSGTFSPEDAAEKIARLAYSAFVKVASAEARYAAKRGLGSVSKALPKKPAEEKPVKRQDAGKASKKVAGAGGKTRYSYPGEKGGDKEQAPTAMSDRAQQEPAPEQEQDPIQAPQASAKTADPAEFANQLKLSVTTLTTIAKRFLDNPKLKGRDGFISFMMSSLKAVVEKHHLDRDYFGLLFDSLTGNSVEPS